MSLPSSFLRFPCFLGLCAFLFMQSLGSQSLKSGKSENSNAKPLVRFTDMAQKAGLTTPVIFGGETEKKYIIETTGTGVAIFDYDNDGWPDIFVVNGTTLEALPTSKAPTSHLYHNNHDGTFTDVSERARLTHTGWGQGECGGGYANGGFEDMCGTDSGKKRLDDNND